MARSSLLYRVDVLNDARPVYSKNVSSATWQRGLCTIHLYMQLDPFALEADDLQTDILLFPTSPWQLLLVP